MGVCVWVCVCGGGAHMISVLAGSVDDVENSIKYNIVAQ